MTSQPPSRTQLVQPSPNIIAPQTTMPSVDTSGTAGTRNRTRDVRPSHAQDPYTRAHEHEREQRPDARHLADDVTGMKAANSAVRMKKSQFDL